jgi:hypothetical protein
VQEYWLTIPSQHAGVIVLSMGRWDTHSSALGLQTQQQELEVARRHKEASKSLLQQERNLEALFQLDIPSAWKRRILIWGSNCIFTLG